MTPENVIKSQVKDYLKLKNIFNFPVLQGIGAYKGIPDRIAMKDGKAYAIELKAPHGHLSQYQEAFKQNWEAGGGIYLEVRKLEDIMTYL